jgi:hypothetical protein
MLLAYKIYSNERKTFIGIVFINTNINEYISNVRKMEIKNELIIKIFKYTICTLSKLNSGFTANN